jgi:23S rRNA (guanosine2251-2'-O)-methyltransferase
MKREVYVLLHDIRSVHNVGSIFRTCDAAGITKIYLSGYSPTPLDRFGNKRKDFAKVSLGAEESVAWKYIEQPLELLYQLKNEGVQIIAVEQDVRAKEYTKVEATQKALFIFGREMEGVDQTMLELADVIAEIPMSGKKESLNVSVSVGIALYGMLKN